MDEPASLLEQMAVGLMELMANMSPLKECTDGYRADLLSRGYSETAAEAMTIDFHRGLMQVMFK